MITSYKEFKEFCNNLDYKPKLLLHSCCGPCSSYTQELLSKYFDVTIFFTNDNIYPQEEFYKRLDMQKKISEDLGFGVLVIEDSYDQKNYFEAVKGLELLGEKSQRCYECYKFRMEKTVIKAKELGFEYFTTTISISPYKIAKWCNEIGYELEKKYGVKYLYSDFKKENGYKRSIELCKIHDIYRQDYCGCVFSLNERKETSK